ncbi:hypothetical protein [Stenotrophomonas rhizophila]
MKDDSGLIAIGAICAVGLLACWWLSQSLGVSMEMTIRFVGCVLGVVGLYGGGSWFASTTGWSNPWPFLLPGLWWAWWPVIIAKGTSTPGLLVLHGVDPGFVWWATPSFRWLTLAVTIAAATWFYVRENRYR